MILCIGEILADMIGTGNEIKMFCGGAPFNVALNVKQCGGKVGFVGKVGKDPVGKFLIDFAQKCGLDKLQIQIDSIRNTTLAFVTLTNGERDFAFFRHDTADFNLEANEIDLSEYNVIHLGSLMLSEQKGREFATRIVRRVKSEKKLLSFDVNFRMDLYENLQQAIKAYQPFVQESDILKFSDDEIMAYTGKASLIEAIKSIEKPNRLLLITLGSKGSMYSYNGITGVVPTVKVKPIDTTGAGDAFFGCFLSNIDGKPLNKENIEFALVKANKKGAEATQFLGAVKL